ncbi:non-homologous end-joining DNA ligase [Nocardioides marmoribigeumensis]|uniref:DNA ligase (ATP) n=1 Tax=Nocardioides marmoribigeumensis TaxID=433649 RepID=A0ABU2C071_9ACTN|nr:non-homologous end-joining DNA ligase [Nocardioides marmoribigeumensis]MDR7364052.1 bifunctional non-homologous end joining protein LigD [Nocardioides marmoribigeumensis]
MRPMLATRGTYVPAGSEWLHEVKWDGMRVIATVRDGRLTLHSRNENDVTVSFPDLQGLAGRATFGGKDVVLDGEVVAFLDGLPVFGALAERMHVAHARRAEQLAATNPVTLLLFDLMHLDGLDLTPLPLEQRRQVLADLVEEGPRWRVPPAYDDGQVLLDATRAQGLEGIVSKRRGSAYRPGVRSPDWLKFPHRPTGSYVVGAWRTETASRRLGSVLVGEPTEEGLVYRGRVGSGLAGTAGEALRERLAGTEVEDSPFGTEVPREDRVGARWVRPEVVLEVASLGLTPQKRLRQPSYLGVRTDLRPEDLLLLEETLDG